MQNRRSRTLALLSGAVVVAATLATAAAQQGRAPARPYTVPSADELKRVEAPHGVVTSANALASEAGVEILRAGGNAVDAVVATAFAIGVVEPEMSGLGASGAAVVWMQREGKPQYLDFYAAQPADSWRGHTFPPRRPQQTGGAVEGEAVGGGRPEPGDLRVAAIPGDVAGLLTLHEKYGKLSREQVMAPAIRLADGGFPVGQVLADFIAGGRDKMKPFPKASALYFPNGEPLGPGAMLRNPELGESLRRIARAGRKGFYTGPIAEALIATLNAGKHPATLADSAAYEPHWKRPLCAENRGREVISAAPPETGLQVLHTLELLEPYDLKSLGLPTQSARAFDVLASALRVGQAAARENGDPNWTAVPANGVSSEAFAATRRPLVGTGHAAAEIEPADAAPFDTAVPAAQCAAYDPYGPARAAPAGAPARLPRLDDTDPLEDQIGETTHMSVVDADGNAVSLTQTNSSVWGSGGFVDGFFINDSGFRFTDANVDAPSLSRWRIRTTTISPTIVLQNGRVQMVIGAPGGGRIPTAIVQVMVYALDYGMDPLDAVLMPRIFPSPRDRRGTARARVQPGLAARRTRDGVRPVCAVARLRAAVLDHASRRSVDRGGRPAPRRRAARLLTTVISRA